MLDYSQIASQKYIVLDREPYLVLESNILRKQQRKPVNQTKIKNLKTGKITERTFHQSEKAEEADIEEQTAVYIFEKRGELWFHSAEDKSERFSIEEKTIGDRRKFLKQGMEIKILVFNEEIIDVVIPIKMDLEVKTAPPAVKGNTAQGGTKVVELETGAEVTVPLFINEGDVVRVNTQTGEYAERVEKK
ncbi:MAG: elongation factor P [Patescibacteria group bacterium]